MIIQGAIRIEHKPHLRFPYVVQVQTTSGRWMFLYSYKTRESAEQHVAKLNQKLESPLPAFNLCSPPNA